MKNNIRKYRKEKGLTQEQLAKETFLTTRTIGSYERNEHLPDGEILWRIATVLDTSPNELLGYEYALISTEDKEEQKDYKKKHLLEIYEQLNDVGKQALLEQAEFQLTKNRKGK